MDLIYFGSQGDGLTANLQRMTADLHPAPPVALVCSVALEARPVLNALSAGSGRLPSGRIEAYRGLLGASHVVVLTCGMGKTNAAHGLTTLLESVPVAGIIGFGVGGSYASSGLGVGDVALADCQIYGDEGVEVPDGWIGTEAIGIPLLETDGLRYFNRFPVDISGLVVARAALRDPLTGPFVTVSSCSGTAVRGAVLERRFGAICETMEGAAYAHIAARYSLPYLEVRGISNLVEDRNLAGWRLPDAAEAAAQAVQRVAEAWKPPAPRA